MLKWTLKAQRQRHLQNEIQQCLHSTQEQDYRMPSSSSLIHRDEEEQQEYLSSIFSEGCSNFADHSLLIQLENMKDSTAYQTPKRSSGTKGSKNLLSICNGDSLTGDYASTLPTFDVEDSPTTLMPCRPTRGMVGKGLQDMYFHNPRYLANQHMLFG